MHSLRVATLRLQARVEHWLAGPGGAGPEERAARRWNRQAEKLRRALSTVRELDVYLGKLKRLRDSVTGPESQSRLARIRLRQIGDVEASFEQLRKTEADNLAVEIKGRRRRVGRLSKDLEAALADGAPFSAASESRGWAELIAGLKDEARRLSAENLHDFRKRVKKVRYVVELSAKGDALAGRRVAALRRMQSAAGAWHDWQTLARQAARVLHGSDKKGELSELLQTLTEESLQHALDVCRRTTERLLKAGAGVEAAASALPPKRSVRSAGPVAASEDARCA